MSQTQQPTPDQYQSQLDSALETLDQERPRSLERMQALQAAEANVLARERERLAAKYGDDHPRVERLDVQITYSRDRTRHLGEELAKARTDVPSVDKESGLVHGRILSPELKGLPDLTVFFTDADGHRVEQPGHACTDEQGYFAIRYQPSAASPDSAFLTVANEEGQRLYAADEPLTLQAGRIEYVEVVLGSEDVCPPPPDRPAATPPEVVRVAFRPERPAPGEAVRFTAAARGTEPLAYTWDFGDGGTGTGARPSHAYAEPGTYTVRLRVENSAGEDESETKVEVRRRKKKQAPSDQDQTE